MSKIVNFKQKSKKNFSEHNEMLAEYDQYLGKVQGLAPRTKQFYCANIRQFLFLVFPSQKIFLNVLSPQRVIDFILIYTSEGGAHRAQGMVYSLRSFFKFLMRTGRIKKDLAAVVPTVPMWKKRPLPVFLSHVELQQMLRSCNRNSAVGLRNYAILMMLITLGVRDCEVCNLKLDDIDWNKGEIIIRGKGFEARLPLSQELGDAFIDYLQYGRSQCTSNVFFIKVRSSHKAYHQTLQLSHVRHIVDATLKRAGLNPKRKGSHLLRHSFATQLLQKGASLQEIGIILRHRRIDTTAIYASVDFDKLVKIAQPWPRKGKRKV